MTFYPKTLELANRTIKTERPAFVMGIVNCTPDSFFANSRGGVERALQLIQEGADILDIGAESTRPGSSYVSEEEELRRIIPVIREVRKNSNIPISVDTRKCTVLQKSVEAGADILNDISALEDDSNMVELVAEKKIPVILMHKRGTPQNMQDNTQYENAFSQVNAYLYQRVQFALNAGIAPNKIILDPGIGFGKDFKANQTLIQNCGSLCDSKYPVLMALSRKSFIGELTGRTVSERLYGTIAANLISVLCGASILRVHDVSACVDMLSVLKHFDVAR